jgi:transposase-like protein
MPWREVSVVDQRREFVRLAMQEGANRRELCRRFGIHPDTGYKWLSRWQADQKLADRSRRPHSSPQRTDREIEERILAVRDAHPAWGARKIVRCLERESQKSPAFSTVHEILRRSDRIKAPLGGPVASQRFEMPAPNLLWQMDFKPATDARSPASARIRQPRDCADRIHHQSLRQLQRPALEGPAGILW